MDEETPTSDDLFTISSSPYSLYRRPYYIEENMQQELDVLRGFNED
jgi:hypothetical protein